MGIINKFKVHSVVFLLLISSIPFQILQSSEVAYEPQQKIEKQAPLILIGKVISVKKEPIYHQILGVKDGPLLYSKIYYHFIVTKLIKGSTTKKQIHALFKTAQTQTYDRLGKVEMSMSVINSGSGYEEEIKPNKKYIFYFKKGILSEKQEKNTLLRIEPINPL